MTATDTSILFNGLRRGMPPHDLANLTGALLVIHEARARGMVTGGPEIDVDRCSEILDHLEGLGIEIDSDQVELKVLQIMAEIGVVRA